jgi:acetyl esterase/lipase
MIALRALALIISVSSSAFASTPADTTDGERAPITLWPAGAPDAVGKTADDTATITPFVPPTGRASGAAAVIFPGGGYEHLATDHEGVQVAHWLTSIGVMAFVVKYRLGPRYHHPTMLRDAQRAVRLVRAHASQWGVDPARIGVVGFSAGGHMASSVGTHFDIDAATVNDEVARASARPDFMVLVYPVITMADPFAHRGSRTNLLGADAPPELVRLLSNETQVSRRTPPTFLIATRDDRTVPIENSLRFYDALAADSVPVELHVFETGRHGFGLAASDPVLSIWPRLCEAWLRRHGWLDARAAAH